MNFLEEINDYLRYQPKTQVEKALRILNTRRSEFYLDSDSDGYFEVTVPSESSDCDYEVVLCYDPDDSGIYTECTCPAYSYNGCKHCIAAALAVREELMSYDKKQNPQGTQLPLLPPTRDAEGYFHFQMENIQTYNLVKHYGQNDNSIYKIATTVRSESIDTLHQQFGTYEKNKKTAHIDLIFNGSMGFKSRCSCGSPLAICKHVIAAFLYLNQNYGPYYFSRFKSFTTEKNTILGQFGLSLNDPEAEEFKWEVSPWGELVLKYSPPTLVPAGSTVLYQEIKNSVFSGKENTISNIIRPRMPDSELIDYELGFVFNFASEKHIGFELEVISLRTKGSKTDVRKLSIHKPENLQVFQPFSDALFNQLLAFTDEQLINYLAPNGNSYLKSYSNPWSRLIENDRKRLKKHYFSLLQQIWPSLSEESHLYQLKEGRFSKSAIQQIRLSEIPAKLYFSVAANERLVTIRMSFDTSGTDTTDRKPVYLMRGLIVEAEQVLYLPEKAEDLDVAEKFAHGLLQFPLAELPHVISNIITPLQSKYQVLIDDSLQLEFSDPEPMPQLLLTEMDGKFLLLKPRFQYEELLLEYDENLDHIQHEGSVLKVMRRNKTAEQSFHEFLRSLHPKFASQRNTHYYFLPFEEVMKGNWFLNMIKQVQENGFIVLGLQDLQRFRYNINTPTFEIAADNNDIDWFDLRVTISWGDQQVALSTIRKAILNKQEAILLDDGTLGMIPEEWLQQYGLLLKIGNEKDGSIKISKLHYSILDELGSKLNNKEVELEIAEKKNALSNYTALENYAGPSKSIQAKLRPYQLTGFQWLQALDGVGWGGCLADDMGLGKTLQTITFLQFLKEKNPKSVQLVICPTSLIFNWENELDKFCPSLKYHTYYGNQRSFEDSHFEQFDIILTTYGVLRLDVLQLSKFNWHYIVLDESQAIKNPAAQVTQCLKLLKAKNRLILSGTPVQNNTSDLYAQFNFINPGFLGQYEFFKREFASPIDKYGDKLKSAQLRRMVYPFMLRRTKEQVAPDLPDKTEMVLWCSMGKEQRNIYEEYKNYYRDMLLQKIEEEGIGKSGIYVLEGLLRLRQICDHPLLVKNEAASTHESVKIEELMREIRENSGGHKSLVFSQFTEMLKLISKELEQAGISYCHLDGSTTAKDRKEAVTCFQEDENIKVFLISLKAGGVGLNLTAADYVYLVDPWWNPAAEQQAIDRTHRIGQTRKIFAYKMICKDTVEEKILQLQQKKKSLAKDLVNEDSGFVKKLTKEDVAFLFS